MSPAIQPAVSATVTPTSQAEPTETTEAAEADAGPIEHLVTVRRGDTLAGLLDGAGIDRTEAHAAIQALSSAFSPRDLRPGQELGLRVDPDRDNALESLELAAGPGRTVVVRRTETGEWMTEERLTPQHRHLARIEAEIRGGVLPTLTSAGMPGPLAIALIRALSHQVDFQRDIQPGDRVTAVFERLRAPDGDLLGHGKVLHAELMLSGRPLSVWRYETEDGEEDWYDSAGKPLRQAFLRTPLDGARVSSGFGMRRHPILGFSRMHAGVDFAAPTGTPVYAAADGTVISARFERGYGRIIRLRHAGGAETRYAHLSRFARGMKPGERVRQGDVIGAVGATGLATGPHLHFEILLAGRQVNPASAQVPAADPLKGEQLLAFQAARRALQRHLAALTDGVTEIALAAD